MRFVKSSGCTDNAEKTTQDILQKNHEIGESPSTDPKAYSATVFGILYEYSYESCTSTRVRYLRDYDSYFVFRAVL